MDIVCAKMVFMIGDQLIVMPAIIVAKPVVIVGKMIVYLVLK